MKIFLYYLFIILFLNIPTGLYSQIPNGGFENWSDGVPDSWWINNNVFGSFFTQTSTSHSGSWAIRGEVLNFAGEPAVPYLDAKDLGNEGFSISQRYNTLSGYYQFYPVEDEVISIWIAMSKNNELIGSTLVTTSTAASSYTNFTIPIAYFNDDVPDNVDIVVTVWGDSEGNDLPKIGTYFLLDDLELSGQATGIMDNSQSTPSEYFLSQNYPNPFNPATTINYTIPDVRTGLDHNTADPAKVAADRDLSLPQLHVKLIVYDILGNEIKTLINEYQNPGYYEMEFNAGSLPSGVYIYRLKAGNFVDAKRMILLR